MTITEMHNYVKLELDKTSSLELPAFEPEEIDYWLNEAERKFKELRYHESFEGSQKRIDDLRTIVSVADLTVSSDAQYDLNSYKADLPTDYMHALAHLATIVVNDVSSQVKVKQISQDALYDELNDPYSVYNLHYDTANPLLFYKENTGTTPDTTGDIIMITDGNYSITYLKLNYLRTTTPMSLSGLSDCELPEHTHSEIVKMAANMMLENIENPRYQTHSGEIATME